MITDEQQPSATRLQCWDMLPADDFGVHCSIRIAYGQEAMPMPLAWRVLAAVAERGGVVSVAGDGRR